jgi:hypothetical protein
MLVFLAADKTRFGDLDKAVRSYLAWQSIEKETVSLNLTPTSVPVCRTTLIKHSASPPFTKSFVLGLFSPCRG